jgi:hypothetical protein
LSDQQMAELYERLIGGKSKKATADRVFLRGWNAGIDFAIKQMRLTCDEIVEEPKQEDSA